MRRVPPPELIDALRGCQRPLLTTHIYPDGDGIGSELALARVLGELGKDVRILNMHPAPEKFDFLDPGGQIEVVEPELDIASRLADRDLVVILDTSEPDRIGLLKDEVFRAESPKICIDHHLCRHQGSFDVLWSEPTAPSTGNMVLEVVAALGVELDRASADPLFVAVSTDTGWFRFGNASPEAYDAASRLVEAGSVPEELYSRIFETSSLPRMQLLGEVLAGLREAANGRVVYGVLAEEALQRFGVAYEEIDGYIDALKGVGGAEILFLVVELSPGRYKVSLRSKGSRDVHQIAESFGGGGHAKAAGCRIEAPTTQEVVECVLEAARGALAKA